MVDNGSNSHAMVRTVNGKRHERYIWRKPLRSDKLAAWIILPVANSLLPMSGRSGLPASAPAG
jgi:hypothetical protein